MNPGRDSVVPLERPTDYRQLARSMERRVAAGPYDGPDRRARLAAPPPLVERQRAVLDLDERSDARDYR